MQHEDWLNKHIFHIRLFFPAGLRLRLPNIHAKSTDHGMSNMFVGWK